MVDLGQSAALLSLFGDPTRVRLLALLELEELTVAELTTITGLGQSRVSTHLGRLREAGIVRDRRAGASTYYRANEAGMPAEARRLWELLRGEVDDALLDSDRTRCESVVRARDGEGWPDAIAGRMERHYSPGRTWESLARGFLGLVRVGDVLDVGCGDGTIAQLVAPRARHVTCLDRSDKLLAAARERLAEVDHVAFELGDMHEIPFDGERFDQVLLLNVLQFSQSPAGAIAEAARVLRPGGDCTIVTLAKHRHASITETYGHLNAGLAPEELQTMLSDAGLASESCAITSRERRKPHFRVVTAFARKP